jgi:hypothetical protein
MEEIKDIIANVIKEDPIAVKSSIDAILKQKIADQFAQDKGEKE